MTIVYTSNTGYTAEYARLLAEETGLAAYPLKEAKKVLPAGEEILYLGWLMAGGIKGYKSAAKRWAVKAVCAVGMGPCGSRVEETVKANSLPAELPLFTLQGGYAPDRLKGINKFLMGMVAQKLIADLLAKPDRTAEDEVVLDLLQNGGSAVCKENLSAILEWYNKKSS